MEHWRDTGIPSIATEEEKVPASSRILAVTSANTQTYALDVKDGLENQDPFEPDVLGQSDLKYLPTHHYPPPGIDHTTRSQQENRYRLNVRRNRHHQYLPNIYADPRRPYLQHPKYKQYITRVRQDTGKDGHAVWDCQLEEAFQDCMSRGSG